MSAVVIDLGELITETRRQAVQLALPLSIEGVPASSVPTELPICELCGKSWRSLARGGSWVEWATHDIDEDDAWVRAHPDCARAAGYVIEGEA